MHLTIVEVHVSFLFIGTVNSSARLNSSALTRCFFGHGVFVHDILISLRSIQYPYNNGAPYRNTCHFCCCKD